MYVFVMMVLASLIVFSMSYTSPHRDDLVAQVEPARAEVFVTNMLLKHEATILRSSLNTVNGTNGEESTWATAGNISTSELKSGNPSPLAKWYEDTGTFSTFRFCVSEEGTYDQYRGILSGACLNDANYFQTIMSYGSPPEKYSKRAIYTAIRKKMKGHTGVSQTAGILSYDTVNSEWDIFPIGGGNAFTLPKNIENLFTDASLPTFEEGDVVIYTKTELLPGW